MRPVSRGEVKQRALQLADVVNDPNITDGWLNQLFDLHSAAAYEFCIEHGPHDIYVATHSFSTAYGVTEYALPQNCHSISAVFVIEQGDRRPLDPVNTRDRGRYRFPSSVQSMELEYVPTCPKYSNDSETFDGVNGWSELISAKMARDIMIRRGADTAVMLQIIADCEARIRRAAGKRDRAGPHYILDVESGYSRYGNSNLCGYRLRGSFIDIYESHVFGWT